MAQQMEEIFPIPGGLKKLDNRVTELGKVLHNFGKEVGMQFEKERMDRRAELEGLKREISDTSSQVPVMAREMMARLEAQQKQITEVNGRFALLSQQLHPLEPLIDDPTLMAQIRAVNRYKWLYRDIVRYQKLRYDIGR
jgi:hypothetical protein